VRLGTYLVTRDVGNLRCQAQMLKAIFGAIAMINWGQINIVLVCWETSTQLVDRSGVVSSVSASH
jgi:hypothetical protein